MQKEEQGKRWHNIVLEDRKVLKATGIKDVEGFDETKVYAMLEGLAFTIGGKNLKVISFSAESGNLVVREYRIRCIFKFAFKKSRNF